jgi:hypothetical protein
LGPKPKLIVVLRADKSTPFPVGIIISQSKGEQKVLVRLIMEASSPFVVMKVVIKAQGSQLGFRKKGPSRSQWVLEMKNVPASEPNGLSGYRSCPADSY